MTYLEPAASQHGRILVVDDDGVGRSALAELLRDSGYQVADVDNGNDGLRLIEEQPFDIVVSDVCMGGVDGFELVERLRQHHDDDELPVILMSAYDMSDRRVRGLDLGADDFVAKPVDFDELLARIRGLLRRSRRSESLRQLAHVDELTGVYNRRGLLIRLDAEIAGSRRSGRPLSVLMLDLDDFKRVNDRYGHAVGDSLLIRLSSRIGEVLRRNEFLGRLGGDEFVLVLPDRDEASRTEAIAKIRERVEQRVTLANVPELQANISIGSATLREGDTPESLLARADEALYVDKTARHAAAG